MKKQITPAPEISRRKFLKRSTALGVGSIAALSLPWKSLAAIADGFPIVDTLNGKIRGIDIKGINTFLGIRYGENTTGKNRFMPPVKVKKWEGIFDAFAYGPASPQKPADPTDPLTISTGWDNHFKAGLGEDCLRLNIWTPGLNDEVKRPVFFYIHGGGFTSGSGGVVFNGDPMARLADAVVITVNHRLGPLGFLDLGALGNSKFEKAGVAGMLDLVAALEWVHDNIERFGGDPGSVTILGQSGGGAKCCTLMAMPSAKGLIHKAVIQSGATLTLGSRENSAKMARELIGAVNVKSDSPTDLQKLHWTEIIEAEVEGRFGPIVDGEVIPTHPCDPVSPEVSADIPVIIGYCKDDMGFAVDVNAPLSGEELKEWAKDRLGENAGKVLSAYQKAYPTTSPTLIRSRISTDYGFGKRSINMAERKSALKRGKVYFYLVEWPSPAYEGKFGAVHGTDLGLILANPRNLIVGNIAEGRQMAKIIGSSVAAFAKTGNPNCDMVPEWPAYDSETRATMIFNTESRVENDPASELRKLWNELEAPSRW